MGVCSAFYWQVKNMKNKDKRLKIMNEILSGIKVSIVVALSAMAAAVGSWL